MSADNIGSIFIDMIDFSPLNDFTEEIRRNVLTQIKKRKQKRTTGRIEFTPAAKRQIVRDCRNVYSFPGCSKKVVSTRIKEDEQAEGWAQGELAHIYPASRNTKGGFRYDSNIPESFIKSRENGMLMCVPHHDEIDDEDKKDKYTAEELIKMREEHISKMKRTPDIINEKLASIRTVYNLIKELLSKMITGGYHHKDNYRCWNLEWKSATRYNVKETRELLMNFKEYIKYLSININENLKIYGSRYVITEKALKVDSSYSSEGDFEVLKQNILEEMRLFLKKNFNFEMME